jgi:pepsin A
LLDYFDMILTIVLKDKTYAESYDSFTYISTCDRSKYPSIYLYIDGKYFEVSPYTYVLDFDQLSKGNCTVALSSNYGDYWKLGQPFLRNYYTIFDDANNRIGLNPHITSNATI